MQQAAKGKILAITGQLKGCEYIMDGSELTIGRDPKNDIEIRHDLKVSRCHCRIYDQNHIIWVEDLNSSNHTYLKYQGLTPFPLTPGYPSLVLDNSIIQIGGSEFLFTGVFQHQQEILGTMSFQLQQVMEEVCKILPEFPPQKKEKFQKLILNLESKVRESITEEALIGMLSKFINELSVSFLGSSDLGKTVIDDPAPTLPPLSDKIPKRRNTKEMKSIRNNFISDIRRCLPSDEDEEL